MREPRRPTRADAGGTTGGRMASLNYRQASHNVTSDDWAASPIRDHSGGLPQTAIARQSRVGVV